MNINDGETHKILFSRGNLFLDGVQIGGEGIDPPKDIMFEFKVSDKNQEEIKLPVSDPSLLEIRVQDAVNSADIGPGQGKVSGY